MSSNKPYKRKLLISYHQEKWLCLLCPPDDGGNRTVIFDRENRDGLVEAIAAHLKHTHKVDYSVDHWHADSERTTYVSLKNDLEGTWQTTQTATFVLPDGVEAVLHIMTNGANRA